MERAIQMKFFSLIPVLLMIRLTIGQSYGYLEYDENTLEIMNVGFKNPEKGKALIQVKFDSDKLVDIEMAKESRVETKLSFVPGYFMVKVDDGIEFPTGFSFSMSVQY